MRQGVGGAVVEDDGFVAEDQRGDDEDDSGDEEVAEEFGHVARRETAAQTYPAALPASARPRHPRLLTGPREYETAARSSRSLRHVSSRAAESLSDRWGRAKIHNTAGEARAVQEPVNSHKST
ncbi:hypothetical protein Pen01_70560 [Phytomonospora endophytica]|nr:hypothetical protein Pen01_70560 [Phytomonospora endophytica]